MKQDDKDFNTQGLLVAVAIIQLIILLAILCLIVFNQYIKFPISSNTSFNQSKDIDTTTIYHFYATNFRYDNFLYNKKYYVLPLKNIQLSSENNTIEPNTLIINGYCEFKKENTDNYNFGKNLVKAVFINSDTIYLLVPVSYMQEWIGKQFILVNDNHYSLAYDLNISGGIIAIDRDTIPSDEDFSMEKNN